MHAPDNYDCPFCRIVVGDFGEGVATTADDVVLRSDLVTAFVASHQWPNNPGHVLVVPNQHFENIYTLPTELALPIHRIARSLAIAMKEAFSCTGTSTRQHNEPDGGQDVWHYHLHVFPRFPGDNLYGSGRIAVPAEERSEQAVALRRCLNQ
ncbi:MAG: HIT family protein [Pseudomonadota bacterium]